LYPFPAAQIEKTIACYPQATEAMWVQDEPMNQGAWGFIHHQYAGRIANLPLHGLGRRAAASPATGSKKAHDLEQKRLLNMVFASADQQPENGVAVHRSLFAAEPRKVANAAKHAEAAVTK
jgi:2-oxoglutarate dehydrogenase E1 component